MSIKQKGQTLIEILLAFGLAAILLPAIFGGFITATEGKAQNAQRLQAVALLQEAEEATRSVREAGWNAFAVDGTYHLASVSGAWSLAPGAETINGFTRSIVISDVNRSTTSGQIVTTGGISDTSTKKVVTTVIWSAPIASSVSSTDYYHRFVNNNAVVQTTQADFNLGTKNGTETTNTNGGEFQIQSWGVPAAPVLINIPSNTDATSVVANGNYAFVGTQSQAGGEFYVYNTTTYTQAATPLQFSEDITAMALSGNYVYAVTGINQARLRVIDVSSPTAPVQVGFLDLGINKNGLSIAVNDGFAYIGTFKSSANDFWIVNISSPVSPTVFASVKVGSDVYGVAINSSATYAFLAVNSKNQLQVVDISNKSSPVLGTAYSVANNQGGLSISLVGNIAYLGIQKGPPPEFWVINVSNPASPTILGSLELGININSIYVFNGIAFLATNAAGSQLKIVNVNNPASISLVSSLNLNDTGNSVYFYNSKVFVATAYNSGELQIITGGGGGTYFNAGTLESNSLDLGSNIAINNIVWSATTPAATTLQFQLAINTDNATWNYFGPDGTGNTYFALNTLIPLDHINGRYVRYKAFLSGNTTNTPIVSSVSINYSP